MDSNEQTCAQIELRHPGWTCWVNWYGDWCARTVGRWPSALLRITKESHDTAKQRADALEQAISSKEASLGQVQ